jgi:hypothetical protein
MECLIRKTDDELQIVYGEVYAPNVPDVHGEFMTPVEVRKMAHLFMKNQVVDHCDTNHDNKPNGSFIVESFIAREDDTVYIAESWVVGMHVPSTEMWEKIKSGEINGFSMEALVQMKSKVIEIEMPDVLIGITNEADNHVHKFEVRFDDEGKFMGGRTDVVNGHSHEIRLGTITDTNNGHTHRYSIAEQVEVVSDRAA